MTNILHSTSFIVGNAAFVWAVVDLTSLKYLPSHIYKNYLAYATNHVKVIILIRQYFWSAPSPMHQVFNLKFDKSYCIIHK